MITFGILILLICGVVYIINYTYKKTNAYYNSNLMNFDFEDSRLGKIIIFGSTYARYAFDGAKTLQMDISNLTLKSQSLFNDLNNFKHIRSKLSKNNIVFITLAPCTLLFEEKRTKIFKFNIPGNPTATLKQKVDYEFPIIRFKKIVNLVFDEEKCMDIYDSKDLTHDVSFPETEMEQLVVLWKNMFGLKNLHDSNLSNYNHHCIRKNTIILEQMVSGCLVQGCLCVIIVPPFSDKLNKYFSNELVEVVLEKKIEELKKKYPDLQYLNYRLDPEFQNDTGLFTDGGFLLNRRGSQMLIRKISNDIIPKSYLNNKNFSISRS